MRKLAELITNTLPGEIIVCCYKEDYPICSINDKLLEKLGYTEEELTEDYKGKIASFVNNMPQWYSRACNSIIAWAKDTYKIDAHIQDIELINIFVLFEQNEDELFGVEFRVEFDVEHGCGIKIKVDNGKYDIIEVGTGDVAFC